jgi:hypothetical protein
MDIKLFEEEYSQFLQGWKHIKPQPLTVWAKYIEINRCESSQTFINKIRNIKT